MQTQMSTAMTARLHVWLARNASKDYTGKSCARWVNEGPQAVQASSAFSHSCHGPPAWCLALFGPTQWVWDPPPVASADAYVQGERFNQVR